MKVLLILQDHHITDEKYNKIINNDLCKGFFGFFLISLKTFAKVDIFSLKHFISNEKKF